ncbi:MAG: phage portal protein [Bacteroidetes bacterium]|nr:phage portal protein [Bacteroidota bacterium]
MKLFGFTFGAKAPKEPVALVESININPVEAFNFSVHNEYIPATSTYTISNGMVRWGKDNFFPLQLADLYNSSAIHQSIALQKSVLITGKDIAFSNFSGLTSDQQAELTRFQTLANGCDKSLQDVAAELSLDYQVFGNMALEVIWDLTFTKIIKINRIPVMNIRLGVEGSQGKVDKYFYNRDWKRPNTYGTTTIAAFDLSNKTDTNQLIFIKNPSLDGQFYGVPTYASGLNWIAADAAISKFHLSNVSNGMAPSLKINFYKKPESPEQRDEIVNSIKREYTGQGNAGKAMILFSDSKDSAPDIEPIQVNNIDKQFVAIADQIVDQITRSHRVTSGIIFGVLNSTSKLSLVGEYESAFNIFQTTVIAPERRILETVLNRILKINGLDAGLYFQPFTNLDTNLN